MIGAGAINDAGWTGDGVRVAVVDSGIDQWHPEFRDANNNGDFDARIAHTAAAADVAITLNGDEEITDLHWLTP